MVDVAVTVSETVTGAAEIVTVSGAAVTVTVAAPSEPVAHEGSALTVTVVVAVARASMRLELLERAVAVALRPAEEEGEW